MRCLCKPVLLDGRGFRLSRCFVTGGEAEQPGGESCVIFVWNVSLCWHWNLIFRHLEDDTNRVASNWYVWGHINTRTLSFRTNNRLFEDDVRARRRITPSSQEHWKSMTQSPYTIMGEKRFHLSEDYALDLLDKASRLSFQPCRSPCKARAAPGALKFDTQTSGSAALCQRPWTHTQSTFV